MKITAVLLAAGHGTRMKSDLPKILHRVVGKPMVFYSLEAMRQVSTETPVLVVGYGFVKSGFQVTPADALLVLAAALCGIGYAEGSRLGREIGTTAMACWDPEDSESVPSWSNGAK